MRDISKEELRHILDKHAKFLKDEDGGEKADLRSANLRSANLSAANLSYADLRSADLSYAELRSADLSYAELSYADLIYADLSAANLRYANLRSADLSYAELRSADLSYAELSYADLIYADLSAANLRYANLRSADLSYATGQYYITQRSDGHQFFLVLDKGGSWMIRAGCRYKSIESYRDHLRTYSSEEKKTETTLILDFAEAKLNAITEKRRMRHEP